MVLHYSIQFNSTNHGHHGEVDYPINTYQNTEPYLKSMIAYCRNALVKSLKVFGAEQSDISKCEFYFYKNGEEIIFFSWEKETVNNEET